MVYLFKNSNFKSILDAQHRLQHCNLLPGQVQAECYRSDTNFGKDYFIQKQRFVLSINYSTSQLIKLVLTRLGERKKKRERVV